MTQDQDEIRPTSSPNSPNERIVELANVLYQVLYQRNPEIVEGIEGLIEYFVEEVWKQGFIQQLRMKEDEKTRLADDEIASRVCDIVKDDFLTFSICESENDCLEMCNEITKQWKIFINSNPTSDSDFVINSDSESNSDDDDASYEPGTCALCHRHMPLTFHHLIPKKTHKKVLRKKLFTKTEVNSRGVMICRQCHSACHRLIPHEKMALEYNTLEKLREHEGVARFVDWASKQREYENTHHLKNLRYAK